MTIHSEHPFLPAESDRNPVRRLRSRMPAPVTVWATAEGQRRSGWTVSSMLVADGDPAEVIGLVDEDSDLAAAMLRSRTVAISLLGEPHRQLADVFAGLAPAPGGPFRMASWSETDWGPVLDDAAGWIGARLIDADPDHAGWALCVRATIEEVRLGSPEPASLAHVRGRYVALGGSAT